MDDWSHLAELVMTGLFDVCKETILDGVIVL